MERFAMFQNVNKTSSFCLILHLQAQKYAVKIVNFATFASK